MQVNDDELILEPRLCDEKTLKSSGDLHLLTAFDPVRDDIAIALGGSATALGKGKGKKRAEDTSLVYIASLDDAPPSRRALFASTYTVWTAAQRIAAIQLEHQLNALEAEGRSFPLPGKNVALLGPPSSESIRHHHELAQGYLDAIAQYVSSLEQEEMVDALERSHGALLHHIIHLAQIIYIPQDGRGDSVVGEEILDWVNRASIAPQEEEAASLKRHTDPFASDPTASWDYLYRCVLRGHQAQTLNFLRLIHQHKDAFVADISQRLSDILSKRPRSTDVATYPTTNLFLVGVRKWRQRLAELQRDIEDEDRSIKDKWSQGFLEVVALASGDEMRILARCHDYGWIDALGAWVTLVRPAATRDDLPEILKVILDSLPIDATDVLDMIYTRLLSGNVAGVRQDFTIHAKAELILEKAIQHCQEFDPWLSTHLTDLLDKLRLVDPPATADFRESLRDYLTLNYADYLRSDPGLWRVSIDYLASCGLTGRARMRAILLGVPFRQQDFPAELGDNLETKIPLVRDILEVCVVHGLEDIAVSVCKVMAEFLSRERQYGRAIAYCIRANDSRRVARIANKLLDEYLFSGAVEFARLVDAMPSSLLHPAAQELRPDLFRNKVSEMDVISEDAEDLFDPDATDGDLLAPLATSGFNRSTFAARLVVLGRLRDYIGHHARGELRAAAVLLVRLLDSGTAPKRIWAALLVDAVPLLRHSGARPLLNVNETYELLRCLEEVTSPIASTGVDSAGLLECLTRRSSAVSAEGRRKDAMRELLTVRQALAQNLARGFTMPPVR